MRVDEELRRLARQAERSGDPLDQAHYEAANDRRLTEAQKRARDLAQLQAAQRERDPDEHPALFRRNAVEGKGWKKGWRMTCGNRSKEKRYLKRKAHKQDRRDAKIALNGGRPRTKKKPGDSWEVW